VTHRRVAVAIPSIPPRRDMLTRALASVLAQSHSPDEVHVAIDTEREGAASTRNRAWMAASTEFVAFLDDDDEMGPDHLSLLLRCALEHDADFVYPWFDVVGGQDPFPTHFGKPWDPDEPRQTTICGLWRRDALEKVCGFPEPGENVTDGRGNRIGEDYAAVLQLNAAGGRIVHLPQRTWTWHHHQGNTSGLTSRW
jgi:hypothetical protein